MTLPFWNKTSTYFFHLIIVSIVLFLGCTGIGKASDQTPPPSKLSKSQPSLLEQKGDATWFGKSKKYHKHGILVVVLRGEPYEIGFARGALLKDEIKAWVKDFQKNLKKRSLETSFDEDILYKRAKEIERFIPSEYLEELKGISDGSGADYDVLLVLNVLGTIAIDIACTSVVVRTSDGGLLRSRNLDLFFTPMYPAGLYFYKPAKGHAFVSISHLPGFIGSRTVFNEKGLSIGAHDISRKSGEYIQGKPDFIMRREAAQYAGSVKEVGQYLKKTSRSDSKMWLVADSKTAGIYEFDIEEIAFKEMKDDHLILTNHTRMLNIGGMSKSSHDRYQEAEAYLSRNKGNMDVKKLIDLNRGNEICFKKYPKMKNLHSAIFRADALDFWVAVDAHPAPRGRWVGFNFNKELYGTGKEPAPLIIPSLAKP